MMKVKFLSSCTGVFIGIWLLAFFCYELMRQHIDRLADLEEERISSIRHLDPLPDITIQPPAEMTVARPNKYEREVYATFLSTRIGADSSKGEFEYDWYFNSTRVLIHRLLHNPSTRVARRVVVLSLPCGR